MKILYIKSYFYPEQSSSDYLTLDLLQRAKEKGHQNIIITPNPIRGLTKNEIEKYKKKPFEVDNDGNEIYRVYTGFSNVKSKIMRFVRSFISTNRIIKKAKQIESDVVIIESNPQVSFVNKIRKTLGKNKKIIFNLHDIYPDTVIENGMTYRWLNKKAIKSLNSSDKIIVLSPDMKNTIIKKGISEDKIIVIPIWISPFKKLDEKVIKEKYNIDNNHTNIFYVGNIGEWQNIDVIIDAFKLLGPNYKLYLVGGGRLENHVDKRVADIHDNRLVHIRRVSIDEAHAFYEIADINLITLNNNTIFYAYPSKTTACINAKKQIVAMVNSNSQYAKTLYENYGTIISEDFSADALATAIKKASRANIKYYDFDSSINREEALGAFLRQIEE